MHMIVFYHHEMHPDYQKGRPFTEKHAKETTERFTALPAVIPNVGDLFQSRYHGRVAQRNVNMREDRLEIWVNPTEGASS